MDHERGENSEDVVGKLRSVLGGHAGRSKGRSKQPRVFDNNKKMKTILS